MMSNEIYLTLFEFENMGFKIEDISNFEVLEILARKKLNFWTKNRIKIVDNNVKLSTALIINFLIEKQKPKITSFSNDGISANYIVENDDAIEKKLYYQILEILGSELMNIALL